MPWQSVQQAKWGHSPSGLKALGGAAKVNEWDAATPKGSLTDKTKEKSKWLGGAVKKPQVQNGKI